MAQRRFNRQRHTLIRMKAAIFNAHVLPKILTALGILFLIGAGTVLWWSRDLPDPHNISRSRLGESTKIYDKSGSNLLYEIGEARRTYTPLSKISPLVIKATVAIEDDQFYEHWGIDIWGVTRAVFRNITGGNLRGEGGSTITQQLIKNSILTSEKTYRRKVKEAILALELERRFSKDEILEMYLNSIPYGNRSYGVEAASQTFFGTSASNLSLAQASVLAALPRAPTYYSPYGSHFEDLKIRQEHIVNRMVDLGMIKQEEADRAKQEELKFLPARESIQAPHFVFYVKELLDQEYGERVVEEGGLKVTTTLDMRLQLIAEEALKEGEKNLNGLGAKNAALVSVNPRNGDILAMAGSIDYFNEEIDGNVNVAVRHRSPGSSIKPFVYAAAFQAGFTPDTMLTDTEIDFGKGYKPKDYDLKQRGPVTIRTALANSLNIPSVETLYLAGIKNSTDLAQRMGMDSLNDPDRYGLSLVLGGGEVRLLDITSAYGVFATEGVRYPERSILKVERGDEVLADVTDEAPQGEQVLDPQISRLVTNILSDNNARSPIFGSRSHLQLGSRPVAAKTGTTQEYRDGWTIGFTPSIAAGVWSGNNDNSPMGSRSDGVYTAAPIWNAFIRRALEGTPIEQFTRPQPLGNIPHQAMRGELPEVKAKWIEETGEIYTVDCPIAQGQIRTFKELHSILYYVQRTNPLGPPPANAESDPQFSRWEAGVTAWRDKHNEKEKNNPAEPIYVDSLPTPSCGIESAEDLPKVTITEPNTSVLKESPTLVRVEVDSPQPLREVRFLLDKETIAQRGAEGPFEARITFDTSFSGRKTLQVLAITEKNLIGRAHRTFIINPDDRPPSIILHTPLQNEKFVAEDFPFTIKVTATDTSGIESVDVLFEKEGSSGTGRIGRTSTTSSTAPNRYEVTWDDSPGPGVYRVFAITYDTTGNTSTSDKRTIIVE